MTAKQAKASSAPLSTLAQKALQYSRKGIPVFPCKANKQPHVNGGFHRATVDDDQVRAWWQRWPDALIGIPTGAASGLFVLDVDADKGGFDSIAELEASHGPLPASTVVRTGGGGRQHYFRHVEGYRCSAGILASGLDVRTTGGYIIAPPSRSHKGVYRVESRAPGGELAEPPAWLLEQLREGQGRSATARGASRPRSRRRESVDVDGPPIGEGGRNDALASIGGKLKRDGLEGDALVDALVEINARRCSPPLPEREVMAVARSVDRYQTGTPYAPSGDALRALDYASREILEGRAWRKTGGKSERSVLAALIQLGRERSSLIPAGVRVQVSVRQLALKVGTQPKSIRRALNRMRESGVVSRDDSERQDPTHSGAIVILLPGYEGAQSDPTDQQSRVNGRRGVTLRGLPLTAPRLRWSAPGQLRLGKSSEELIDILEDRGGRITLEELAEVLQIERVRDLRRRVVIPRLCDRGIAVLEGEVLALVDDWREALAREREASLEIAKSERDAEAFKRQTEAYRLRIVPDDAPSEEGISEERAARLDGRAAYAYAKLMDPNTKPGMVYRSSYGSDVAVLASVVSARVEECRGNPEAWRAWLEPVRLALEVLDGQVGQDSGAA